MVLALDTTVNADVDVVDLTVGVNAEVETAIIIIIMTTTTTRGAIGTARRPAAVVVLITLLFLT